MRRLAGSVVAATLLLGACGQSGPAAPAKKIDTSGDAVAYRKTLLALAPEARNSVFFRAIASANGACPAVKSSAYQEDYKDMSMWVVRCDLSGDWAVFVNGNGFAQTRQCDQVAKLGLPACKAGV